MKKQEVQQRVLHNGKMIDIDAFEWDEKTKSFSSHLDNLVLDFNGVSDCTFNTGSYYTFNTGSDCTFNTGSDCTFDTGSDCTFTTGSDCTFDTGSYYTFTTGSDCTFTTGSDCTFDTGSDCTFTTGYNCTFDTGSYCTFTTGYNCTFNTGYNCTFTTGYNCTFNTGYNCTFNTGSDCTFTTGSDCTFDTGSDCTFTTGYNCTFTTGYNCTFKTGYNCTFTTGYNCVVVRRQTNIYEDVYEVIELIKDATTKLLPYEQKGYIVKLVNEDYFHYPNQTERIELIDGIVSKVIQSKGNVLKVINNGETTESYIVSNGDKYAHGKTIKGAKESLIYKIADRNTDEYKGLTLESEVTFEQGVEMYRKITGSCESMTKQFAEANKFKGKKTIQEIINITKGQYNNSLLEQFFSK